MSKRIQLNTIDLGGGTTKGCNCEAPNLSDYAKKEDVEKAISDAITKEEDIPNLNDIVPRDWNYLEGFLEGNKINITKEESDKLKETKLLTISQYNYLGDDRTMIDPTAFPIKFLFSKVVIPMYYDDYTEYKCFYQWSSQELVSYISNNETINLGSTLNLVSNSIYSDNEDLDFDFDITEVRLVSTNLSTYKIPKSTDGGGFIVGEYEDGAYMSKLDNIILEKIGYDYYAQKGNVYFEKESKYVEGPDGSEQVQVLKAKVHGLGTAAYKSVEEIVELVKQSINS